GRDRPAPALGHDRDDHVYRALSSLIFKIAQKLNKEIKTRYLSAVSIPLHSAKNGRLLSPPVFY
ncbi:MAG: hypothetical protein LC130_33505, partial [Bryobacterales bacterium]|nr:hypothetical protein [Bryobacterales bacterium]